MPRLPPETVARRNLQARGREAAEEILLPLLRSTVSFPGWLLDIAWEHGLDDLRLRDVWCKDGARRTARRGPLPRDPQASETMSGPSASEILAQIARRDGATTREMARVFKMSANPVRIRLRTLIHEGLIRRVGTTKDTKYMLTAHGLERLKTSTDPGRPSIRRWLAENCETHASSRTPSRDLYRDYKAWCRAHDVSPETMNAFGRALGAEGLATRRTNTHNDRVGVRLRTRARRRGR